MRFAPIRFLGRAIFGRIKRPQGLPCVDSAQELSTTVENAKEFLPDVETLLASKETPVVGGRSTMMMDLKEGETYWWCTCGSSKNQPWCDGYGHDGTSFQPIGYTATETKPTGMCVCKQTKNAPFCDGSHNSLPDELPVDTTSTAYVKTEFKEYKVVAMEEVANECYKISVEMGREQTVAAVLDGRGSHFMVKVNDQVRHAKTHQRPYTPYVMAGVHDRFTLAIKRYPGGAVTGALARLRIGDYLAMAGPIVANKSDLSKVTRYGMVAGGSGVTPMLNVIYHQIRKHEEQDTPMPDMVLMYSNRTFGDIILKGELDALALKYPSLKICYSLTSPEDQLLADAGQSMFPGKINKALMAKHLPPPGETTFLSWCGPPGMCAAVATAARELGYTTTHEFS